MQPLRKAQLAVGLLACFAIFWGLLQDTLQSTDLTMAILMLVAQLVAIFIIAIVLMNLLEWVKIFDLKTNAILTLLVLVSIRLLSII
jgi:hypothetical protein